MRTLTELGKWTKGIVSGIVIELAYAFFLFGVSLLLLLILYLCLKV